MNYPASVGMTHVTISNPKGNDLVLPVAECYRARWHNRSTGDTKPWKLCDIGEAGVYSGIENWEVEPLYRGDTSEALVLLLGMTDEERLKVMSNFCKYCGCDNRGDFSCQCWNDE